MSTKYYCIFDFVKFKWVNPLKTPLGDYAIKYSRFQVHRDDYQANRAPVEFTIHSKPPSKSLRRKLSRTSERFYGDENLFQVDHQLGCRRWSSWVADLSEKHVHIWYHFPWYNRTRPVSWLSSDLMICFHVIQPILEYKLQELGMAVLHAPDNPEYANANSTSPTSVAKYQDRQDLILNEWAIGRALEWEMNSAPPSEVNIVKAIALAQKIKSYALNLDTISFGNSSEGIIL